MPRKTLGSFDATDTEIDTKANPVSQEVQFTNPTAVVLQLEFDPGHCEAVSTIRAKIINIKLICLVPFINPYFNTSSLNQNNKIEIC